MYAVPPVAQPEGAGPSGARRRPPAIIWRSCQAQASVPRRRRCAETETPSASRASPSRDPVGVIGARSGSHWDAHTVARWRSQSARAVMRRSQDRTVSWGTLRSAAIARWPPPAWWAGWASNAAATTSMVSARRGGTSAGSSTWVAAQSRHRARLALECLDHQREPSCIGQQPDGDLRLESPLFGEPGLTEPVTLVGLEVQGRNVVEDQAGWPQGCALRARGRELLAPPSLGMDPQTTVHRGVGGRHEPGFLQHTQTVELGRRLDDPRQHQLPKHLITAGRLIKAENVVGTRKRIA